MEKSRAHCTGQETGCDCDQSNLLVKMSRRDTRGHRSALVDLQIRSVVTRTTHPYIWR
jgi:hypothetical protein